MISEKFLVYFLHYDSMGANDLQVNFEPLVHDRQDTFRGPLNIIHTKYEPRHAKTCLMTYGNNKGADQPAHQQSLISTFLFAA